MSEPERIDPTRVQEEDTVVTADGENLGHVIAFWPDMLTPSHLVVEGGLIIHHHWYVPVHAIAAYVTPHNGDPGLVTLGVTHGEINEAGWTQPPPGAPSVDELIGG
jgi:hypothetical protein